MLTTGPGDADERPGDPRDPLGLAGDAPLPGAWPRFSAAAWGADWCRPSAGGAAHACQAAHTPPTRPWKPSG